MTNKILSFIFGIGLILGLIFGGSRLITQLTFRNSNWYSNIQSKIYYVDRTFNRINLETDRLLKEFNLTLPAYEKIFTRDDIQKLVNQRNETAAYINLETGRSELEELNIKTLTEIENLVVTFLSQLETTELTLPQETIDDLKIQLIHVAKRHLIRFDTTASSLSNIENRSTFFIYFIYLISDYSRVSYLFFILFGSIFGLFILYFKSIYKFLFSLCRGFLLSGVILHVYSFIMIKCLNHYANHIETMTGEFAYASYLNRLGSVMNVSKGLYLIALIFFLSLLTLKHYKDDHCPNV